MERVKLFSVFIKEDGGINVELDESIKEFNISEEKICTLFDEDKLIEVVARFVENLDKLITAEEYKNILDTYGCSNARSCSYEREEEKR